MKTCAFPRLTIALLGGVIVLRGAPPPAPAGNADKTQVLYMGLDLSVMQGKKFHRIENVEGSEFVIRVDGENKFVRTRMQTTNLKLDPGLKLSPVSVQLDDLQGGPGYTPENDPRLKMDARSGAAGGAQAAHDLSSAAVSEITDTLTKLQAGDAREGALRSELERQEHLTANSSYQMSSDYGSIPNMANQLALELAEGNFDMIDVSCRISSPVPLDRPYLVVLVEFLPRDAKPGETSTLIHARALDPIEAKPRYVRVREGGMPVGFKFQRFEVHVYNRGKEVATNASARRVALTADEARQYLLLDYLGGNKTATLPATAVAGSLSPAVRARLQPGQLQRVVYVRVAPDGTPREAFADAACQHPLDDAGIAAALAGGFFKPALDHGQPVAGVARLNLADLTL